MYYPEELVEEVRARNDIVDVISGYVTLKKKGSNYWGCCPFHNEKTPSFSVSSNKQMYYCFGCHASGNVYTFLMKYENDTFPEAVKILADRAGVKLPEVEETPEQKKKAGKRMRLLEVNKEAARYFYYMLRSPHGEVGMRYLTERKLTDETMHHFGLGYAGKNGEQVVQYLRKKGFTDEEIKDSGLAMFSEQRGLRSQFWNRVMFPIQDINHRVIGFGGRVMGDGEPKYLNSPETMIFDKRRNLYGLNFARTARTGNIILCEGYMDVIAMHQAGFTQAVASLGTAFTVEQANLLHRYAENILLAYDSDGAGTKAALRGIGILREAGLTGKVINMRPYKDPDEFIKNLGKEAFQERIDQAENSFLLRDPYPERTVRSERSGAADEVPPGDRTEAVRILGRSGAGELSAGHCGKIYDPSGRSAQNGQSGYASQTGLARPIRPVRAAVYRTRAIPPESGRRSQTTADHLDRRSIRSLYRIVRKYISSGGFHGGTVPEGGGEAVRMSWTDGSVPAWRGSSVCLKMRKNRGRLRSCSIPRSPSCPRRQERERAFHEILLAVKTKQLSILYGKAGDGRQCRETGGRRKKSPGRITKDAYFSGIMGFTAFGIVIKDTKYGYK